MIDENRIRELEPEVRATAAIYSPSTGIVDAHGLMDYFYRKARRNSAIDPLVLNTEVTGLHQKGDGYVVNMVSSGDTFSVEAGVVINAAGLHVHEVAGMAGIDIEKEQYRIHWCKGDYFSLKGKAPPSRMLVYPVPPTDGVSLGIHTVPDLTDRLKFGPNAYYVDEIDYKVESNRDDFWRDILSYLSSVRKENLHPDIVGDQSETPGAWRPLQGLRHKARGGQGFPGAHQPHWHRVPQTDMRICDSGDGL